MQRRLVIINGTVADNPVLMLVELLVDKAVNLIELLHLVVIAVLGDMTEETEVM